MLQLSGPTEFQVDFRLLLDFRAYTSGVVLISSRDHLVDIAAAVRPPENQEILVHHFLSSSDAAGW